MLVLKFNFPDNLNKEEHQDTLENILNHIKNSLNFENIKTISDKNSVEVLSMPKKDLQSKEDNEKISVELSIIEKIYINKEDLDDKYELDKFISGIKHFANNAKNIEDYIYIPLNKRES